jgi:putative nucleotidyltransferase with HDIG domain
MNDAASMLKRLDRIDEIQALPDLYVQVSALLEDKAVSAAALSQVIERDQAMVAMLLRLVNSAFYGLRSRVGTIAEATVILGFNTIQNAILSMSVCMLFSGRHAGGCDVQGLWRHSLAVAVAGRHLALRTRRAAPENAFVGGLLHDLGKTVLCQYFEDLYQQVAAAMAGGATDFFAAEKGCLPLQHPFIGAYLAEKWHLPAGLVEAIRNHHRPAGGAEGAPLPLITAMADWLVNRRTPATAEGPALCPALPDLPAAAAWIAPHLETADDWFPGLAEEIESACAFFLQPR